MKRLHAWHCPWISLLFYVLLVINKTPSFAQTSYEGELTTQSDYYHVTGNKSASPYPYPDLQSFSGFRLSMKNLNASRQEFKLQFSGIMNDSKYKNRENGLLFENIQVSYESMGGTPFRFYAGDFYGFLTSRTLQRSMKGLKLELQPKWGDTFQHSFLFIVGTTQTAWKDLTPKKDTSIALSYLLGKESLGMLNFQYVKNKRDIKTSTAVLEPRFTLWSVGYNRNIGRGKSLLYLEGEFAKFSGDTLFGQTVQSGKSGSSFYLLLKNETEPLQYRFRYEKTGKDYGNTLSFISSNRRSIESMFNWKFHKKFSLGSSLRFFRDGYEDINPIDTHSSEVFLKSSMSELQMGYETVQDKQKTFDLLTRTYASTFHENFGREWKGTLRLYYRSTEYFKTAGSSVTKEASFSFSDALKIDPFQGNISPKLALRHIKSTFSSTSTETHPQISLSLSSGKRSFSLQLGYLVQNRGGNSQDISHFTSESRLTLGSRKNQFDIMFSYGERAPSQSQSTQSLKFGISYRRSF